MSAFKYGSRPNGETMHMNTTGENAHLNKIFKKINLIVFEKTKYEFEI